MPYLLWYLTQLRSRVAWSFWYHNCHTVPMILPLLLYFTQLRNHVAWSYVHVLVRSHRKLHSCIFKLDVYGIEGRVWCHPSHHAVKDGAVCLFWLLYWIGNPQKNSTHKIVNWMIKASQNVFFNIYFGKKMLLLMLFQLALEAWYQCVFIFIFHNNTRRFRAELTTFVLFWQQHHW